MGDASNAFPNLARTDWEHLAGELGRYVQCLGSCTAKAAMNKPMSFSRECVWLGWGHREPTTAGRSSDARCSCHTCYAVGVHSTITYLE